VNRIDQALTETLADLIRSAPGCQCCGTADSYAEFIQRALARTPVDWWPDASCATENIFYTEEGGPAGYRLVLEALVQRKVLW